MKKLLMSYHMPDEALVGIKDKVELIYPDSETVTWEMPALLEKMRECAAFLAIGHKIDRTLLDANPQLEAVANLGVGYDNIDVTAATEKNVCVINTPNSVTQPTAELTIAIILNVLRNIYFYEKQLRETLTVKTPLFPVGLTMAYGKTLGIVGFGRIGKAVAKKALGLEMKIVYSDPVRADALEESRLEATYMSFEEVLRTADIVTLHCPYTPENHHLFSREQFRQMKPSAYLVNAARGPIVEEAALIVALRNKEITGAALDVYEYEPKVGAKLATLENLALSPHIGSGTYDARIEMTQEALAGLVACLSGEKPHNLVNPEVLNK